MKYFVILLVSLGFIGTVYAVPFISPDYSYEIAKHVVIGRVLSIEFLEDPNSQYYDQKYSEMVGLALYEIEVEEYLKNSTNNSTIKVLGRYIDQRQSIYYETFPYEINQRVLLYIQEAHDFPDYGLIIDPRNSRVISEDFSAKQMMTNIENESAPLKQINGGIPFNEIKCKDGLVLIQKYDDSPACVKPETKSKLIERGWAIPTIWKKYITISAARIDISYLVDVPAIYKLDNMEHDSILYQSLVGADGCKSETEFCALPRGISIDRQYPFGISLSDHDTYSITLNTKQANDLLSQLDWTIDENWIYTVVQWNEKYYLFMLSTFDNTKTPDVKMSVFGSSHNPVSLERGKILNYTVEVETWATYGRSAQLVLEAVQDAKDSGLNVWMEPDTLVIPERSSATATLFIQAKENAKDGIYDVRVIGHANGNNAGLYCSNTTCPVVNIGNSDWSIRTFGSSSGMGIGSGDSPENTWAEIELNKKELFEGDIAEIKAFVINNGTESIMVNNPRELLIKVIRADSKGYYDHFYGIHARYESDKPIVLEPDSKTLLARTFYWNQTTYNDFDAEQRLEPSRRMITMVFVAGNYTWNSDTWIEIK